MTIISELRQAYKAENLDAESLKDSMADMMNTLVGTNKKGSNIGNEEMGEDFVYTSLVYDQLKKQNPSLAETFKSKIAKVFNKLNSEAKREFQPLYKATNRILKQLVKAGDISKKINKVMIRIAFGKCQLDNDKEHMKRKPTVIDKSEEKTNVDEVIEKIGSNRVASNAAVNAMTARVAKKQDTVEAWEKKNKYLDGLKADPIEIKTEADVTPAKPVEEKKEEEKKINVFKGGINDMVFDPKSEYGKPVFILPDIYSNVYEIDEIIFEDKDGASLGEVKFGGTEEGLTDPSMARKFYYLDGDVELPSDVRIKLSFKDTDEIFRLAFDSKDTQIRQYKTRNNYI